MVYVFRDNVKSVFLQASVIALAQSATFYLYSGGYSFGAYLVINERATYDELFRYCMRGVMVGGEVVVREERYGVW